MTVIERRRRRRKGTKRKTTTSETRERRGGPESARKGRCRLRKRKCARYFFGEENWNFASFFYVLLHIVRRFDSTTHVKHRSLLPSLLRQPFFSSQSKDGGHFVFLLLFLLVVLVFDCRRLRVFSPSRVFFVRGCVLRFFFARRFFNLGGGVRRCQRRRRGGGRRRRARVSKGDFFRTFFTLRRRGRHGCRDFLEFRFERRRSF